MNRALRFLMVLAGILAGGMLLILLSMSWAMPANELKRWRMERAFAQQAHPPDSTLVAPVSLLGVLDGNGNHCDFLVGHWRRSSASGSTLRAAYDTRLSVYRPDEPLAEDNYAPGIVRWLGMPGGPDAYLVYEYDGMNDSGGDARCW